MPVRYATIDDLDQLMRIETMCFHSDLISKRDMCAYIKDSTTTCRIEVFADALYHKELHGYILLLTGKRSKWVSIHSFAVKPTGRGKGVGEQLIDRGCELAKDLGYKGIKTHVRVDNPHAILRYKKSGFRISGVESDYYEDQCDAVIYSKTWDMK